MNREVLQFLPAALEIQATPPLPASRFILWAIMAFFSIAVAWACIGQIDIVGVAPGKIIPSGRTKAVQALETSIVRRILVAENEHVVAGQLLIELDPTESDANHERLRRETLALALDAARLASLTTAVAAAATPTLVAADLPAQASPEQVALQSRQLERQHAEYLAAMQSLVEEAAQTRAELAAVRQRRAGLDATLPLLAEQADAVEGLVKRNLAPRMQWLELERQHIAQASQRDALAEEAIALQAEVAALESRRLSTAAQFESRWLAELGAARGRIRSYEQETVKAEQQRRQRELRAPVDGTVQQLAVHSIGGVVTPAQQLLVVVPDGEALEVEAWVENKDIGFVSEGQPAEIKIDTFPFTRYGTIEGEVMKLSDDAVSNEQTGLAYMANVRLERDTVEVDGRPVKLAPGMSVSVELQLGKRRVIELLLSPLLRYRREAGRER